MTEIYLTREQIYRLAGLANDALVGMEVRSDCSTDTYAYCVMVDTHTGENRHFEVNSDGSYKDVT
jgi:hypothetical protein